MKLIACILLSLIYLFPVFSQAKEKSTLYRRIVKAKSIEFKDLEKEPIMESELSDFAQYAVARDGDPDDAFWISHETELCYEGDIEIVYNNLINGAYFTDPKRGYSYADRSEAKIKKGKKNKKSLIELPTGCLVGTCYIFIEHCNDAK